MTEKPVSSTSAPQVGPPDANALPIDARRRRLKFRAWHRGIKEMDLILGHFADTFVDDMPEEELAALETLLQEQDTELYYWVSGRKPVPDNKRSAMLDRIMKLDFMPEGS